LYHSTLGLRVIKKKKKVEGLPVRPEARTQGAPRAASRAPAATEFLIDSLLVRIPFIIVMIRWTGLTPRE